MCGEDERKRRKLSLADGKQSICASCMHEMRRDSAERNNKKEFLLFPFFSFFCASQSDRRGKARGLTLVLFWRRLVSIRNDY